MEDLSSSKRLNDGPPLSKGYERGGKRPAVPAMGGNSTRRMIPRKGHRWGSIGLASDGEGMKGVFAEVVPCRREVGVDGGLELDGVGDGLTVEV